MSYLTKIEVSIDKAPKRKIPKRLQKRLSKQKKKKTRGDIEKENIEAARRRKLIEDKKVEKCEKIIQKNLIIEDEKDLIEGNSTEEVRDFLWRKYQTKKEACNWELASKKIDDKECKRIAFFIKTRLNLTSLSLYNNNITDNGIRSLTQGLKKVSNLSKLHLGYNQISDQGALMLADILKKNSSMIDLSLSNNTIGDAGASSLADALIKNSSLIYLRLDNNKIGDLGAKSFADALQKNSFLKHLALSNNDIGGNKVSKKKNIINKKIIQLLNLMEPGFTAVTMKLMEHHPPIPNDPKGSKPDRITDSLFLGNVKAAADHETLKRLGITHILNMCAITIDNETGSDIPKSYCSFTKGYLGIEAKDSVDYPINNDFQKTFIFIEQAYNSGGKILIHSHEGISRSVAITIAYLMKKLRLSLMEVQYFIYRQHSIANPNRGFREHLRNYEKELTKQGIIMGPKKCGQSEEKLLLEKENAFASKYELKSTLIKWNLTDTKFTDQQCLMLSYILKRNTILKSLNLTRNCLINDAGASSIAEAVRFNVTLTSLDIRGNPNISLIACQLLANVIAESETINNFSDIPVYNMKKNLPTLKSLDLLYTGCGITEGLVISLLLKKNTILEKIILGIPIEINEFRDKTKHTISYSSNLKSCEVSDAILIDSLIGSTVKIKCLDMRNNPDIGSVGGKILADTIIKKQNIDTFSGFSLLKLKDNDPMHIILDLNDTGCSDTEGFVLASLLEINTVLKKINLQDNCIGDIAIQAIANCLKKNFSLSELNLVLNQSSSLGAEAFANTLQVNTVLTSLDIRYNLNISENASHSLAVSISKNNTIRIFNQLSIDTFKVKNPNLEDLDLHKMGYSDAEACFIGLWLENNSTLINLNLCNNIITSIGANAIIRALKKNSTLIYLRLSNNRIGDIEMQDLEVLKENNTLEKLILTGNRISDINAHVIGEVLKINNVLKVLYLSYNNIGDPGAQKIGDSLKVNRVLKKLYLSYNNISDLGVQEIAIALEKNEILRKIDLKGNMITSQMSHKLKATIINTSN